QNLESHALSVSQVEKILSEVSEGEFQLKDGDDARSRLREKLGLPSREKSGKPRDSARREDSLKPHAHRRPGERRPVRDVIGALGTATCRSDLRYLTFLPFKHLFSNRLLLRTIRAWCPECYQEMAATGTVHEPLLWCLKLVEACPRHRRLLTTACSRCRQSLR